MVAATTWRNEADLRAICSSTSGNAPMSELVVRFRGKNDWLLKLGRARSTKAVVIVRDGHEVPTLQTGMIRSTRLLIRSSGACETPSDSSAVNSYEYTAEPEMRAMAGSRWSITSIPEHVCASSGAKLAVGPAGMVAAREVSAPTVAAAPLKPRTTPRGSTTPAPRGSADVTPRSTRGKSDRFVGSTVTLKKGADPAAASEPQVEARLSAEDDDGK